MSIIEQLARYLAPRLGMTFEEDVFFGYLPPAPAKAVCVYAGEIRPRGDREGCRVRVAVRSARDGAWPVAKAEQVMRAMEGLRDAMLVPGGMVVHRAEVERGFEFAGMEENATQFYTADFRVYACGGGEV